MYRPYNLTMNAASTSSVARQEVLSTIACRKPGAVTPTPPFALKATNCVAIASYFLPLMAAYLNILDGYDLRSFKAKVETTCSSRRSINDGEADFERTEECAHWRWCDRGRCGED